MHWVLFCRVIDHWGDVGVCWRLACHLTQRGARVTLYCDDLAPLAWLAQNAAAAPIQCHPWQQAESDFERPGFACDVVIEAFACHLPAAVQQRLWQESWVWINLEYLSAEPWVERCHLLPSPQGPKAKAKWFFHPGFTPRTGGLLRAPLSRATPRQDLARTQLSELWFACGLNADLRPQAHERVVLLFSYANAPLHQLSLALGASSCLVLCLGDGADDRIHRLAFPQHRSVALPRMSQVQFDALLRCSDLNLVRGEDSWVQALWACAHGIPCVWHIYVQHDAAHQVKLNACLEALSADALQTHWHHWWNGLRSDPPSAWPNAFNVQPLLAQDDLCTQLWRFALAQ